MIAVIEIEDAALPGPRLVGSTCDAQDRLAKHVLSLLALGLKLSQSLGKNLHNPPAKARSFVGDIAAKRLEHFLVADIAPRGTTVVNLDLSPCTFAGPLTSRALGRCWAGAQYEQCVA